MKHQIAYVLFHLKKKGDENTPSVNKVSVLGISQHVFACAPKTKNAYFLFFEDSKGPFVLLIPEVGMTTGVTDSNRAEIPTFV